MLSVREYFFRLTQSMDLQEVRLRFDPSVAPILKTAKYYYGFIDEEEINGKVEMNFMTSDLHYFARWLIMYADGLEIISPEGLKEILQGYVKAIRKRF